MRNLITAALVLGLSACAFAAESGYEPVSGNLLTNPSFADGKTGWKFLGGATIDEDGGVDGGAGMVASNIGKPHIFIGPAQQLDLEADTVYRLTFKARSDGRCYVSARFKYKGGSLAMGGVKDVPKKWKQCSFLVATKVAGQHELLINAPSAWWPEKGKVWIDDVSLVKIGGGEATRIGSGLHDDYPVAAGDGAGNVWMAHLAFDAKSDSERIFMRKFDGKRWSPALEVAAAKQLFAPALAVGARSQYMAWSQRDGDWWNVYARQIGAGLGPAVRITDTQAMDRNVSAAITASGQVWVAWQSDRTGNNDVYAARVNPGPIKPIRISQYDGSDYNPAILAVGNKVYVAWDSFRGGNYDVFMRAVSTRGAGKLMQISDSPLTDRRPFLTADEKGRLWIAYQTGRMKNLGYGRRGDKTYALRVLDGGKLYAPTAKPTRVWTRWDDGGDELPALAVSKAGGVRLVTAVTQANLKSWLVADRTLSGDAWSRPALASGATYIRCRRPAIVAMPDGSAMLILASTDRTSVGIRRKNLMGAADIRAIRLDPPAKDQLTAPVLKQVPLKSPAPPAVGKRKHRTIAYEGKTLKAYFGDLHSHSTISACVCHLDALPDDIYAYARDNAALDFTALTDHGGHMNDRDFHTIKKLARANHQPGICLAMMAQEWSSAGKGGFGHKNIIYDHDDPKHYFNPHKESTQPKPFGHANPTQLWAALRGQGAITIPHQIADGKHRAYTDWSFKDKLMQPVAEILQNRGSYEFKGAPLATRLFAEGHSLHDAWAMGHILGVIASPDHGGGRGRAVVLAENLTRKEIVAGLRARRCYGTSGAKIFLDFRVNGRLMGEEITVAKAAAPRKIAMTAEYPGLHTLVLYRSNKEILRRKITGGKIKLTYTDEDPLPADQAVWYYVRVEGKPDVSGRSRTEVAWSSPVWVSVAKK